MASWPQIKQALNEKRRELCLTGKEFNTHLEKHGLDADLYQIASLNYLTIHNTCLTCVADNVGQLTGLQTLSLHSNKIETLNANCVKLSKLKVLDVSRNQIATLSIDFNMFEHLTSINLSGNLLESFPPITKCTKLQVLDLSNNKLGNFPEILKLENLLDMNLNNNLIEQIPDGIEELPSLKTFDISSNKLTAVPSSLANCGKLKELNLKGNPIKDRRLLKLIDQCRTKQVLDYIQPQGSKGDGKKKAKGKTRTISDASSSQSEDLNSLKIHVKHSNVDDEDGWKIIVHEEMKNVRPFIVCCLVHGVEFTDESMKRFIQVQNKLHDTLCDKRNGATIATHDADYLKGAQIIYTALPPKQLMLTPLNRAQVMSGHQLFHRLQLEAENLRKEKKRSAYSGIHKYLYLLEGKPTYSCLIKRTKIDGQPDQDVVISFPPITNSDVTKISTRTKTLFLEVTGSATMTVVRKVMDSLIMELVVLMNKDLAVEQIRNVDVDGNMKSVYPSKTDLRFETNCNVVVSRDKV